LPETKEGMTFIILIGLTIYGLIIFTANRIYNIKRREEEENEE
jgi:hypothetical protein